MTETESEDSQMTHLTNIGCVDLARFNEKARIFMQNLIYPAFLGTFIVSVIQSSSTLLNDTNRFSVSLLFLFYFATLFVETEVDDKTTYCLKSFIIDVFEVAIMFAIFMSLGVISVKLDSISYVQYPVTTLLLMAVVFSLPVILRALKNNKTEKLLDGLCIAAIVTCLGALVLSNGDWSNIPAKDFKWSCYSSLWGARAIWSLWFIYGVYVLYILVDTLGENRNKTKHSAYLWVPVFIVVVVNLLFQPS
jgi:hypothetical protein